MMLNRIDAWLGRTLFHPPIIKLCHMTRHSQNFFHSAFWFAAACTALYFAESVFATVLHGVIAFGWMLAAGLRPDMELGSMAWFRGLLWASLGIDLVTVTVANDYDGWHIVYTVFALFAEYAATIKTLPPRRIRERAVKGVEVKA